MRRVICGELRPTLWRRGDRLMKVLIVHYNPSAPGVAGGAESAIRDQGKALTRLGHKVKAEFSHPDRAAREFGPDIIHFHTIHVSLGLKWLAWAKTVGIPHCLSLHDYWPFCGDRMLMRHGAGLGELDEPCAAVTGVCDGRCRGAPQRQEIKDLVNDCFTITFNPYSAAIFERHGIKINAVVPHGVDTDFFAPPPEGAWREGIICVSAWPQYNTKGVHVLRRALRQIGARAKLVTGKPREYVRDALQRAEILVFPSTYEETWGLCLTEGMATGCACVASDVAGARYQIAHGQNGLLVPPRNAGALAEAIEKLLRDKALRGTLGNEARKWACSSASLEAMGQRYEAVYREVMAYGA